MVDGDEYLTVAEIAERVKVNPQTVRNWIDRGDLAAVRAGPRQGRVRSRDLDAFLGGSTQVGEREVREAFSERRWARRRARETMPSWPIPSASCAGIGEDAGEINVTAPGADPPAGRGRAF